MTVLVIGVLVSVTIHRQLRVPTGQEVRNRVPATGLYNKTRGEWNKLQRMSTTLATKSIRLVLVITSTINTHWFKTFSTHEIWVFRQYIKHISHEMLYIISDRAFTANTLIAVALFSKRIVRSIELKHFL